MTDDELHQLLGAYLLGGLDSADRERFARHLAACEACRDELARSAALPSLLRRAEGLWEPGVPTAPPTAPPELLDRVRAGRAGVRRRRRWAVVGVVAASLTLGLLAGLLTAGAVADRRAEVATAARTAPLESTGGSLSSGRVSLSSRPWLTRPGPTWPPVNGSRHCQPNIGT